MTPKELRKIFNQKRQKIKRSVSKKGIIKYKVVEGFEKTTFEEFQTWFNKSKYQSGCVNRQHKVLMEMVDSINKSIGRTKVKLGSQDADRTWKMRQERLSPRYTTRINEAIIVKA